jgi:hypothetical protein
MQIRTPLLTRHRRQRLVLWTLAMLSWIAVVLFSGKHLNHRQLRQRHRRLSLEGLTRTVIQLTLLRAAELGRWRRGRRLRFFQHGRDLKRRHYIRSMLGARLRRQLGGKSIAARIANLIAVLRNLDTFARALSRRHLTRLWSLRAPSRDRGPPARTFAGDALAASLSFDSS